ncbi:MAG: FAD-dependent thymidylate synthase [Candidatus Bathyarchaeota archaeon]|nr:FAD-dependent thymidylate synthase [Candidatus Bathyarchaeota archaeon]
MKAELLTYTPLAEVKQAFPDLSVDQLLPHLCYTFAIEKISRACSHQLVRHRVASFSQQSQRYITVKRLSEKTVVPPSIGTNKDYESLIESASEAYQNLVSAGVPREDARFVLPNAAETSLLMTMEGKSLMHFLGLRTCNRAQWEVRELADMMLEQLREVEPSIFNNAGPYCYQLGYCPEGRHTCGRMKEALERYRVE